MFSTDDFVESQGLVYGASTRNTTIVSEFG